MHAYIHTPGVRTTQGSIMQTLILQRGVALQIHIHTYIHTYIHTNTHTHIHAYIHTPGVRSTQGSIMQALIFQRGVVIDSTSMPYTHSLSASVVSTNMPAPRGQYACICMYVCTYICMHACMLNALYAFSLRQCRIYQHACPSRSVRVYMYVCMHVYSMPYTHSLSASIVPTDVPAPRGQCVVYVCACMSMYMYMYICIYVYI